MSGVAPRYPLAHDLANDLAAWRRLLAGDAGEIARQPLFAPLLGAPAATDGCFVLGRIAQSLDGRIATASGASRWIGGREDILHTHRLRALCDAVLVGAGTLRADDPQLTTREVEGPSPARVVLDTDRRLDGTQHVFHHGPPTLLLCAEDAPARPAPGKARVVHLPRDGAGLLSLAHALAFLAAEGLRRLCVEGGGITLSRFLAAGMLDRLHVTLAPLLLGAGIPAFTLPAAASPAQGLRVEWTVYPIGADLLLDIPLHRVRPPSCRPQPRQ